MEITPKSQPEVQRVEVNETFSLHDAYRKHVRPNKRSLYSCRRTAKSVNTTFYDKMAF